MGNEGERANLSVSELHLSWDQGYETAGRAAAQVLTLPSITFTPGAGPSLHFGALPTGAVNPSQSGDVICMLHVEQTADKPLVYCLGRTPQDAFYALRTLLSTWEGNVPPSFSEDVIVDRPAFAHRGIAEAVPTGWTWKARNQLLLFAGRHQFDHYMYAPDDDLYRTERWREPYPPREAANLTAFISQASQLFVSVIYNLEPILDPAMESDLEALESKCRWVLKMGAEGITLSCDIAIQGVGAWARLVNQLLSRLRMDYPQVKLWVALLPSGAGDGFSECYLYETARSLNPEVELMWKGPAPINRRITEETVRVFLDSTGRKPWLWENYPDNRFAPLRLFLGPYEGREPALAEYLTGVTAVPMQQALASQIPLATVADFLWDPESYDADIAWERALRDVGGRTADALYQFAGLNRSSVLNHREDEDLETALAAWELEGFHGYLARRLLALEDALGSLGPLGDNQPLMEELSPWLEKASYLTQTAMRALELSYSLRTTRKEAPELYQQTVSGLGRSRQLPHIVAPFRLDRFAVRVLRQTEVKLGRPLGRIQTTAPRGRNHPWGLAADGDLMTSFRATADLQPGHSTTLDMGTVMEIQWVHLSQGYFYYWSTGCVEEGRLLSSADGETWEELTGIDSPGAWEVDLHLDPPKAIRYLRLVNDSPRPWPMVIRQLEVYE